MARFFSSALVLLALALYAPAQSAPDAAELTKLLNDFLWGASRNDVARHERFWADDLIYTGAAGRRIRKLDIMNDVRSSPTLRGGVHTTYSAEDVRIQQYGNTAIVAFRLVGKVERGTTTEISWFLNTGTFLKRGGKWQAVSWQATRMPRAEADRRKEVEAIESAFHKSTLAADIDKLGSIMDESFIWTQGNGSQLSRQQLLEQFQKGHLKYSRVETSDAKVTLIGDTAIVRGVTSRQRVAIAGATGDATPFTAFYTLTFVNKGGPWKAVAMHTSLMQ